MTDIQQTVQDVQAITPYVWEIMSVVAIFVSLTVCQYIKKFRYFPDFMCNYKYSKDRVYIYKKIKPIYLKLFATLASFVLITYCLSQRYGDINQVMMISGFAAILQWSIVEIVFKIVDKRFPGVKDVLSDGLYFPEEDKTVFKTTVAVLTGGGVEKKKKVDFNVTGNGH